MQKRRWRTLSLLALVAFAAHLPSLLGVLPGAMPSTGDTLGAFVPWDTFVRRALAQDGSIPLWNPHLYAGLPFLANGQSGLFYPPNLLHFVLPENLSLWFMAYSHSLFYMLGGYFLGRTLGLKRRAAFLVAVLIGLGNANPSHLYGGHLTFLPARSYWPWEAAFLLRFLRGGKIRDAICWAACISLSLAAGAPQIWLFGLLFNLGLVLAWSVRRLQKRQFSFPFRGTAVVVAFGLCVLWCAPILLPLRELRDWSSHGTTLSFAEVTSLSATPRSLFRLLFNGFFGGNSFVMWSLPYNPGEDAASIGFAPFILALGAVFWAKRGRVVVAWLFAGMFISLLLALGDGTPLYRLLYDHVLLFQITRVPARWLELCAFCAALLAGFSFDGLLRRPDLAIRLKWVWGVSFLACCALGAGVLMSSSPWKEGAGVVAFALKTSPRDVPGIAVQLQQEAFISCILAGASVGALFLCWRGGLARKKVVVVALALLFTEPLINFWLGVRIAPPSSVSSALIPRELVGHYRPGDRWIVRSAFGQLNAPLSTGIDALNGYEPFGSRPFFEYASAAQGPTSFSADFTPNAFVPLWRVAGVSYLAWKPRRVHDDPRLLPGGQNLRFVAQSGEWRLLSWSDRLTPWPRAYLTPSGERNSLSWRTLLQRAQKPFSPMPGAAVIPQLGGTDVENWNFVAPTSAFFVNNEMAAPGWKAFVDGEPKPLTMANVVFRGVDVPAGKHQVSLVLDSQTLRFSLFLALSGITLAAALITGALQGHKKLR